MKKILGLFLFAALFCGCSRTTHEKQILFQSYATDSIPYRIPALAELYDGSVLALTDFRPCGQDIGFGRVDINGKILDKSGRKWSDEFVLAQGTGVPGAVDCGYGDAALVADRESDEIIVGMVCGNTVYWRPTTNRQNPNRISLMRSLDGGKSWSLNEITEDIYSLFDAAEGGCVQSCFLGSGRIFQSKQIKVGSHYRIYSVLTARPRGNRVIYSDDFGRTWNVLGGLDELPAEKGDEAKCEELPDGRVILSSRANGGRLFNIYTYTDVKTGQGSWGEVAFSGEEVNGCVALQNACNGEILVVPAVRNADGKDVSLVLQSVPFGPKRANVGIYVKELPEDVSTMTPQDLAEDWPIKYQISDKFSAYSTMIQLRNGDIAFFYEETHNGHGGVYDMVYQEFSLETITAGQYRAK